MITLLVFLVVAVFVVFKVHTGKTQDELVAILRQELQLSEDDCTAISCVGEYAMDDRVLLWFYFENQPLTYYRAVECSMVTNGRYQIKEIYKPTTYAQDIVHIIWNTEDIFLINNAACQSIVYKYKSGEVISERKIAPEDIPYVFVHKPEGESVCDFLDAAGNVIR